MNEQYEFANWKMETNAQHTMGKATSEHGSWELPVITAAAPANGLKSLRDSYEDKSPEFHLPDEDRSLRFMNYLPTCPSCKLVGQMIRQDAQYLINCPGVNCQFRTPAFEYSQDAIHYWKMQCLLLR